MKRQHRRALAFLLLPLLFLLIVIGAAVLGLGADDPDEGREDGAAPAPATTHPESARAETPPDDTGPRRRRVAPEADRREEQRQIFVERVRRRAEDRLVAGGGAPEPGKVLVPVAITLPSGRPPAVATVRYDRMGRSGTVRWRPDAPLIELAPGTYVFEAFAGAHREYHGDRATLKVPERTAAPVLHLPLAGPDGVAGTVRVPAGEGLTEVVIRATYEGAEDRSGETARARAPAYSYRFPDLAPGPWAISAHRYEGGMPVVTERIDVAPGFTLANLELPPLLREEYLVVRVLRPDGAPEDDAAVALGIRRGEDFEPAKTTHGIDRGEGVHWVLLGRGPRNYVTSLEEWAFTAVSVTSPHGTAVVPVPMTPSPEVTVRFREPAVVEARITGTEGHPMALLGLFLEPSWAPLRGGVVGHRTHAADGQGRRTFEGLQPGEYDLMVAARPDHDTWRWEIAARRRVTVGPGTNVVSIPMPPLHALTVRLPAGAKEVLVQGRGVDPVFRIGTVKKATAVFERLPAGEYTVHVGVSVREVKGDVGRDLWKNVQVPDEREVIF